MDLTKSRRIRAAAILSLAALVAACGGGGGSDSETGQFVDSEVQGLRYVGDTFSGTTDAMGRYGYLAGDGVCFSIGSMLIGCGEAKGVFTPIDLFVGATSEDCRVINVVRFLLSLDADGDASNGIDLTGIDPGLATIDFDQTCEDFATDPDVLAFVDTWGFDGNLVGEEDAVLHFETALEDSNYFEQALLGRWMYAAVGESGPQAAEILDIDGPTLEDLAADVMEGGEVTFETTNGADVCGHYGGLDEEGFPMIYGEFDCDTGVLVPGMVQIDLEGLGEFRMDRLDPDVVYVTEDLIGSWIFASTFHPEEPITIAMEDLAPAAANVSGSGVVTFMFDDGETCSVDGQMSPGKDFVAGDISCSVSGSGVFYMAMTP